MNPLPKNIHQLMENFPDAHISKFLSIFLKTHPKICMARSRWKVKQSKCKAKIEREDSKHSSVRAKSQHQQSFQLDQCAVLFLNAFLMVQLNRKSTASHYNYFERILSMTESSYSMEEQSDSSVKRPYRRVTEQDKAKLFKEVFENRMKITKTAKKLGLNLSTAKFLIKRYKRDHNLLKRSKESPETTPTLPPMQQSTNAGEFQPFCYIYFNGQMVRWGTQQGQLPYSYCYPAF